MIILKPFRAQPGKNIGFFLPEAHHSILVLHSLTSGIGKSQILRDLVEKFYMEVIGEEDVIYDKITKIIIEEWKKDYLFTSEPLSKYGMRAIDILKRKGVEERSLLEILKRIDATNTDEIEWPS